MELLRVPKFHTKDEEIQYWMDMANKTYQKQEEMKRELEEYQENSIILERELETSYEQSMERNRDLQLSNNKLTQDNDDLKARLHEQVVTCTQLQCKVQELQVSIDSMKEHIRKLELTNDDLERTNRELKGSEEAMEDRFNDVIEKLALLETEVEEKEGLQIIVQRLKDENKDLKHQIQVDLRKTQGSPMTRIRKMSMARRHLRRNSAASEKSLSIHEESFYDYGYNNENTNLFEYISELEKQINDLKKNQRTSKIVVVDVATKSNTTIETNSLCKSDLDAVMEGSMPGYSKDEAQEVQVRLRSPTGISVERGVRPLSIQSNTQQQQEEASAARAAASSRSPRLLMENRIKKVNTGEKRKNLMHFLKRFRYSQPGWMRRKH